MAGITAMPALPREHRSKYRGSAGPVNRGPTPRHPSRGMARTRAAVAAMTAGTAVQASLTVPGQPDQVHTAREFAGRALGADHPCAPLTALLISELVTNSVLHSDSRLPGNTITITLVGVPGGVRVEVRDAGGASVPLLGSGGSDLAEHGRGLRLVSELSDRWDYRRDHAELVTWFEVRAELPT
jgi:anti-sigma regulatory factor (Ser/Thr protein kinase)